MPALGHVPALDGLRGTAMVLVLLSHLWVVMPLGFGDRLGPATGLFNSGSFGVLVFLVLGGFLVTSGLLSTRESTGSMGLARFWSRRLARICGPLFAMLAVVVLVGLGGVLPRVDARVDHELGRARRDVHLQLGAHRQSGERTRRPRASVVPERGAAVLRRLGARAGPALA